VAATATDPARPVLPAPVMEIEPTQETHHSASSNLLLIPARNPKTLPATPVIISMLSSCQAITEMVIATTVPQTMERNTCGRTFANRIFIT
jgi:hypothetical protein